MPQDPTPSIAKVSAELHAAIDALAGFGDSYVALWQLIRVPPQKWRCSQYPGIPEVWVAAVIGRQCFYFNAVEHGWGWGAFETWREVTSFHWDQLDAHHASGTILAVLGVPPSPADD